LNVDVFALGTCLYYMLTCAFPFCDPDKDSFEDLCRNVYNFRLSFPSFVSPEAEDLIRKLLQRSDRRLDWPSIWAHPWLSAQIPAPKRRDALMLSDSIMAEMFSDSLVDESLIVDAELCNDLTNILSEDPAAPGTPTASPAKALSCTGRLRASMQVVGSPSFDPETLDFNFRRKAIDKANSLRNLCSQELAQYKSNKTASQNNISSQSNIGKSNMDVIAGALVPVPET